MLSIWNRCTVRFTINGRLQNYFKHSHVTYTYTIVVIAAIVVYKFYQTVVITPLK